MARRRYLKPLRGSLYLPTKRMRGTPSRAHGNGSTSRNRCTSIPLGTISYGPWKYWLTKSRAGSETAMRASRRDIMKVMYGLKAVYQGLEARNA